MNSNGQIEYGYWQMIEMQKDPVAWMWRMKNSDNRWELAFNKPMTEKFFDTEPLYTHPSEHDLGIAEAIGFDKGYKAATAKTLTDEEIMEIAFFTSTIENDWDNTVLGFARAILKKASEK